MRLLLRCNIWKNWCEPNGRSGKFARGCTNEGGTCASDFTVVKLHNASEKVISSRAIGFNHPYEITRFENNVSLSVSLRKLIN